MSMQYFVIVDSRLCSLIFKRMNDDDNFDGYDDFGDCDDGVMKIMSFENIKKGSLNIS
jgi:hypothetical protein